MKINKILIIILSSISLTACKTNKFCIDMNEQKIISDAYLSKIILKDLKTDDIIIIKRKHGNYRNKEFYFKSFDTINYSYSKDYFRDIKIDNMGLKPNSSYEIINASIGDATNYTIKIFTDSSSLIIKSDCFVE